MDVATKINYGQTEIRADDYLISPLLSGYIHLHTFTYRDVDGPFFPGSDPVWMEMSLIQQFNPREASCKDSCTMFTT